MKVGLIANPASGKDIRRLTSGASVFNNQEKSSMVKRLVAGIESICPDAHLLYFDDSHRITHAALSNSKLQSTALELTRTGTAEDSTNAAAAMRGSDVVVSLGGDGTNRAIAKGWEDVPLVALSTGTNNAFPELREATTVGYAIGVLLRDRLNIDEYATSSKIIHIQFSSGLEDVALIDVVGTTDRFQGSRAIVDPSRFRFAVLSVADPSSIGMTSVGGLIYRIDQEDDYGMAIEFRSEAPDSDSSTLQAPIAPGIVRDVAISRHKVIGLETNTRYFGPLMVALDGEREHRVKEGEYLDIRITRTGPRRIDIDKVISSVALEGASEFDLHEEEVVSLAS